MNRTSLRPIHYVLSICVLAFLAFSNTWILEAQSNFKREQAEVILDTLKNDIKSNYYDPNFHGIDLDVRFKTAKEKLKTTESPGQMFAIIAQTLLDFDDSHLFFLPPGRVNRTDYGWEMEAVGDQILVSAVKPGSDAEAKGLKEGDRVISINNVQVNRDILWKVNYLFRALRPQPGLRLLLADPQGKQRELTAMAKIKTGKQVMDLTESIDMNQYIRDMEDESHYGRSRWVDFGEELLIWKLPTFEVEPSSIDSMLGRLKKHKTVVLDLRGNGGGYVETCQRITGAFLGKETVMAETKRRKDSKVMKSKDSHSRYEGNLIVLIDSGSASASEIFARVMQLEKRGIVIGDRSAGAVMEARFFDHKLGVDTIVPYGASVTDADLIMGDGKSLERVGVIPDELLLPSPADMAAKRDPVLSRAAEKAGVQLDPAKAGTLFPIEWPKL
jgi:carboxyl-terminal processing protease